MIYHSDAETCVTCLEELIRSLNYWPANMGIDVFLSDARLNKSFQTTNLPRQGRVQLLLSADWAEMVYKPGLALIRNPTMQFVNVKQMFCRRADPMPRPEGCDGAWRMELCYLNTNTSRYLMQLATCAVRYGGRFWFGDTVAVAFNVACEAVTKGLGVESDEDWLTKYLEGEAPHNL